MLRNLLRKLCRGLAYHRTLRVDGFEVPLFVAPDAQLKYLKPGVQSEDRELIRMACQHLHETSVVWDIGANLGVFSFASALQARAGTVVAVEADVWLAVLLNQTRLLPAYADCDIRIVPAAVADKVGVMTFLIADGGRASNALEVAGGRTQMGGVRMRQFVPTLTLDTLLDSQPPPDFVKIDIEGAEWMALCGAERLLKEVRPIFYIEVGADTATDVYARFAQADYIAVDPATVAVVSACVPNTYFVPRERQAAFSLMPR